MTLPRGSLEISLECLLSVSEKLETSSTFNEALWRLRGHVGGGSPESVAAAGSLIARSLHLCVDVSKVVTNNFVNRSFNFLENFFV